MLSIALLACQALNSPEVARSSIDFGAETKRIALRDMDGDGLRDLVGISNTGLNIWFLQADGRYSSVIGAHLPWPADRLAWELADLDQDGRTDFVCLIEGKRVRAYELNDQRQFDQGRLLVDKAGGYLPKGVFHMAFARDIDADGGFDLVVPCPGLFKIFLSAHAAGAAASWSSKPEPLSIRYETDIRYGLGNASELSERDSSSGMFSIDLSIPWFTLEDVDGDGRKDLISKSDGEVGFHLASPELSQTPTWTLDLDALRAELKQSSGINFDDLLEGLTANVDWRMADIDGVGARDLLIQKGSFFEVYLGGTRTGIERQGDDGFRLSGNVITFLLRAPEGQVLPNLIILRAEKISLGEVVRWLILPGSLDFQVFTFQNRDGRFERKPSKRQNISLRIPRLLSMEEEFEELGEELSDQFGMPTVLAEMDGDGLRNDVVDIVDGELLIYANAIADGRLAAWWDGMGSEQNLMELVGRFLEQQLADVADGGTRSLDVGDLRGATLSAGAEMRAACAKIEPSSRFKIEQNDLLPDAKYSIVVVDINGNGRNDVFLIGDYPEAEDKEESGAKQDEPVDAANYAMRKTVKVFVR